MISWTIDITASSFERFIQKSKLFISDIANIGFTFHLILATELRLRPRPVQLAVHAQQAKCLSWHFTPPTTAISNQRFYSPQVRSQLAQISQAEKSTCCGIGLSFVSLRQQVLSGKVFRNATIESRLSKQFRFLKFRNIDVLLGYPRENCLPSFEISSDTYSWDASRPLENSTENDDYLLEKTEKWTGCSKQRRGNRAMERHQLPPHLGYLQPSLHDPATEVSKVKLPLLLRLRRRIRALWLDRMWSFCSACACKMPIPRMTSQSRGAQSL